MDFAPQFARPRQRGLTTSPPKALSHPAASRYLGASYVRGLAPAAWFRKGIGLTSAAGKVSAWADQSGNGRNLVQGTGAAQPSLNADGSVQTAAASSQYMKTAAFTLNQPTVIFLLGAQIDWTLNNVLFDGNGAAGGALQQATSTPNIVLNAGAQACETSAWPLGTVDVLRFKFQTIASSITVGAGASTFGSPGSNTMGGFTLGATGVPSNYGSIKAYEIIIFDFVPTDAQIANIYAYMQAVKATI